MPDHAGDGAGPATPGLATEEERRKSDEDAADLLAFEERLDEPELKFRVVVEDLRRRGRL